MKPLMIQMQRRKNRLGMVKFRALCLIQDIVIDGWADTPEDAHAALKAKLDRLIITLSQTNQ